MKRLKKLVKKDWSRFLRYSLVGAIWTAFNIGSDVVLIDYWSLPGWLGTLIGILILYLGRYFSYLLLNVIQPEFLKYVYSTAIFTLIIWGLKIVALDVMEYKAVIASPIITGVAFVFKYFFYKSIGLLQSDTGKID
jgi:putative flippase GtrA